MRCPNCQRENESTGRFCIFCGSLLPAPEAGGPSELGQGPVNTSPEQPQALQEEMHRLSTLVALMNDRLAALERRQGIYPAPSPEPTLTPATGAIPSQEAAPVSADIVPPGKGKPAKVKEREWEQILGGHWLARIGVIALVIGIGFFLKFAFDTGGTATHPFVSYKQDVAITTWQ